MSRYLDQLDGHLGNIERAAEAEDDPHRSDILWNYLHHGAFEVGGDWERIFAPAMIVDDPHYEMRTGPEGPIFLDGQDAVREFYGAMEAEVMMLVDDGEHHLFVNDEGLAEFGTTVAFVPGRQILDAGVDSWFYDADGIDDPDATYLTRCRHAMYWPYTDDGRLIGEMVYQLTPYEVSRPDPAAVPTLEGMADVVEKYYPENVDGASPYASMEV